MTVQLLQGIYLFKEFLPEELEQISKMGVVRSLAAEEKIFEEGDRAQSLFVIRHGTVQIQRAGKQQAVEVSQLGTGAHFGEMSFVDGEPRSATAVTAERSEVLEIGFDALRGYLDKHPPAAVKFYRSLSHFLAGRLRLTTTDLSFSREKNIRHF